MYSCCWLSAVTRRDLRAQPVGSLVNYIFQLEVSWLLERKHFSNLALLTFWTGQFYDVGAVLGMVGDEWHP